MEDDKDFKQGSGNNSEGSEDDSNASPRMYDFSSDLNISPVKDEPDSSSSQTATIKSFQAPSPIPKPTPPPPPAPTPTLAPTPKPAAPKPVTPPVTPSPATPPTPTPPPPPTPTPPKTPVPKPAAPQSYREPIETAAEWPFASSQKSPVKASPIKSTKIAPSNAPVKTIHTDHTESPSDHSGPSSPEQKDRPATDLQRDVLAILPNLKKSEPRTENPKGAPIGNPPSGTAPQAQNPNAPGHRPFENIQNNSDIKPLRTYETDVAEAILRHKSSRTSMALAENKRETGEDRIASIEPPDKVNRPPGNFLAKLFYGLLSLMLIGAGAIGGYYLYTQSLLFSSMQAPAPQIAGLPEGLLRSNQYSIVAIDGLSAAQINTLIKTETLKQLPTGDIREIVPVQAQADGIRNRISAEAMVNAMGIKAPGILVRTLEREWMMGAHADQDGRNSMFAIVRTNFFQNAFAGMLQWEVSAAEELKSYIDPLSTTTLRGSFNDKIIRNKDVRTFVTEDGQELVSYSFADNSTIVIAQSESAMRTILSLLENRAFVR